VPWSNCLTKCKQVQRRGKLEEFNELATIVEEENKVVMKKDLASDASRRE
jgi:hypothetical protein